MATVTGMTAEKILEIVNEAVISADIDEATGVLTLRTRGGQTVTAGNVDITDQAAIEQAATQAAVDRAHPVGSIFMSTVATSPATLLGIGTWTRWGKGRVPVSLDEAQTEFDAVEETGGEKTHTLSVAEMPAHKHGQRVTLDRTTAAGVIRDTIVGGGTEFSAADYNQIDETGGGQAHNNLQPYITCYMWKRTA